jgi:hypothetical protein
MLGGGIVRHRRTRFKSQETVVLLFLRGFRFLFIPSSFSPHKIEHTNSLTPKISGPFW